jgi:hypothetical protein
MAVMALLLPGLLLVSNIPTSSAAAPDIPEIGRVTVSGTDILVDGKRPNHQFYGVVDTTALAFAIEAYIYGNRNVAGWTSVFNAPDTGKHVPVTPNDTPDAFWNQYFAQMKHYGVNLVRIGAGDSWGTEHQYKAWKNYQDEYFDLLHSMSYYAQANGVWLCFVLAGAQEYPTYHYYGTGSVFDPSSSAFANYIEYSRSTMVELENENAIAMYDMFNEPDHNNVNTYYWHGNKVQYNQWSKAVDASTAGVSGHPRTLGVAGFGNLFGMTKRDFDLATGDAGFEILHRHYYGSNADPTNFALPEEWAKDAGKPLLWGELANNGPYPLIRYDYGEKAIWKAGGQAITSMVLTGTPGYPYYGGVSGAQVAPRPSDWKGDHSSSAAALALDFTSTPSKTDKVGSRYEYKVTGNKKATIDVDTNASFLLFDKRDEVIRGIPGTAGTYAVRVTMEADGQKVQQEYELVIEADPEKGTAEIVAIELGANRYSFSYRADLGDGPVSSSHWDFGDGTTSSEPAPVHAFPEGEHLVTLTLTGENGTMLNTTYGVDDSKESAAPGAGSGQSIAGAVGWGTTSSALMVVGLVCASVIGIAGYLSVSRGGGHSYRHHKSVRFPDPRTAVGFGKTTLMLLKEMNYPDRKLIRDLCLYLLKQVRTRGFSLVISVKDQALDGFRLIMDTAAKHLRPRK